MTCGLALHNIESTAPHVARSTADLDMVAAVRQECARYLETYKAYESKPADTIQGRTEEDYLSKLNAALTTVRGINKTDVLTLGAAFKTAAGIIGANMQQLSVLPGIGPTKVRNRLRLLFK